MAFARTILAALVAISLAMVPVTAAPVVSTKSTDTLMADNADMPCCPPNDSNGSVVCAFKCLNFVVAMLPLAVVPPYSADGPPADPADDALHEHVSAPAHPPPI
jgi:hypothetical protein